MFRIVFIIFIIGSYSCGGNQKKENATKIQEQHEGHQHDEMTSGIPKPLNEIPNPLDFLDKERMEQILGLEPGGIYSVVPNEEEQSAAKTVFYRISDPEKSNAAILVSIYGNPFTNEIVDESWAFLSIDNLKAQGSGSIENPEEFEKYEDWDMGLDGAFSKGVGKYFWRDNNHFVYFIAFNTSWSLERQHEIANSIGKIISP